MRLKQELIALFTGITPEFKRLRKLDEARATLVDHECQHEYYGASVQMLKARIERLEAEEARAPVHRYIQAQPPFRTDVSFPRSST